MLKFYSVLASLVLLCNPAWSANLADVHQAKGQNCSVCHASSPAPGAEVESGACLNCHTRQAIEEKYSNMGNQNPHKNHLGELECTLCHKGHQTSQSYCLQCHSQMKHNM